MNFNSNIQVHGVNDEKYINFGFCIGNEIYWNILGIGKSTIANLLASFWDIKNGKCTFHISLLL